MTSKQSTFTCAEPPKGYPHVWVIRDWNDSLYRRSYTCLWCGVTARTRRIEKHYSPTCHTRRERSLNASERGGIRLCVCYHDFDKHTDSQCLTCGETHAFSPHKPEGLMTQRRR